MDKYNKLFIIISRKEKTQRTAQRIKNTASIDCEIIFLEDITFNNLDTILPQKNNIIYFLTNHPRLGLYIEHFIQQGRTIINSEFLKGERSKLFIQNKIATHNISTPANELLTDYTSNIKFIQKIKLPVFIKSQEQMNTVLYIKDYTNLKRTITRLQNNIGEWYIEKAYNTIKNDLIKAYYTYGKIYTDTKAKKSLEFMHNIAKILSLDVFSVDIIIAPNNSY